MTWLAYPYIGYLTLVGARSVKSSAREHAVSATTLEVLTAIAWPILVAAFFAPALARKLGWGAMLLFAVAAPWTAYTIWRDVRRLPMESWLKEEEHPRAMYWAAIVYSAIIVVPVAILSTIVVIRLLKAS